MIRNRLHITIFISALLHLAVFSLWWNSQQNLEISTTPPGALNVSITEKTAIQPAPATQHKESNRPRAISNKSVNSPTAATTEKHHIKQPVEKNLTNIDQNEEEQQINDPAQQLALLNNHMVNYLNAEFKLRFKYPMLARKRGWQGEVLLGLDINRHGEIAHVAIQRSSGYKVLDYNAVRTFKLIGAVSPEIKAELLDEHHLSIPVIYKLTGG